MFRECGYSIKEFSKGEITTMKNEYDIIVIGSGAIGSTVARQLSRYKLNICVLEKEFDVCSETSGRNSGVLHAGFNNKPGTLMAKYCVEGNLGFDNISKELDIPFKRTGKIVVGFTEKDKDKLLALKVQGELNGVPDLQLINKERIKELAPYIKGEFALYSPTTSILNPFTYTIALAENAYQNDVDFYFDNEVIEIDRICKRYFVKTSKNIYKTKWVINCAGLNADKIARMLGVNDYKIYPCKGEYFILDKKVGKYLNILAYPIPNLKEGGLGIHITPTISGNILIGPSTEYIDKRNDYASTQETMDLLIKDGKRIFPYIKKEFFIRNFVGIRPKLMNEKEGGYADFVIEQKGNIPNVINLVGIESPGLTSAIPIANRVVEIIKTKEKLIEKENFDPIRKGIIPFNKQTKEVKERLIKEDPNYGEIICRCETITKAEIIQAINNPLGVKTVVGIKNRTRAMMGRCQGGYCQARIVEIIMEQKNIKEKEVVYSRKNSEMFMGKVRE